jgi:3',5'-cyclic AMP phosphodiesterase CpdA
MAEHPAPERVLLHLSDTHLRAVGSRIWDRVSGEEHLARLAGIEASGVRPDAIVVTGDLVDLGERAAYATLRAMVEPWPLAWRRRWCG